jgi:hypothetical protein
MPPSERSQDSAVLAEDIEHQQLRVLALINAVTMIRGNANRLDGLTKLAKLDFIARYPELEAQIARVLFGSDSVEQSIPEFSTLTVVPMIRYRYGPWDERYYPVIGALVGRGLIRYAKGKRGAIGFSITPLGKKLVQALNANAAWAPVVARYSHTADRFGVQNGNRLKDAIYKALPDLASTPFGTELK